MPFFDGGFGLMFVLFPVVLLGLIVLGLVAVASRRGEADPKGRRPLAVYLLAVMFVTLFVAFGAVAEATSTLVRSATGYGGGHGYVSGGTAAPVVESVYGDEGGASAEAAAGEVSPSIVGQPEGIAAGFTEFGNEGVGRRVLEGLVVALVAGAVFLFHARRFRELLAQEAADG